MRRKNVRSGLIMALIQKIPEKKSQDNGQAVLFSGNQLRWKREKESSNMKFSKTTIQDTILYDLELGKSGIQLGIYIKQEKKGY